MRPQEWEVTIQEIIDECNQEQEDRGEDRILMKWRAKLEKEPDPLASRSKSTKSCERSDKDSATSRAASRRSGRRVA